MKMLLFDNMREATFEQRFGLDQANRQHLARIAQEHGTSEAEIQAILSGRILFVQGDQHEKRSSGRRTPPAIDEDDRYRGGRSRRRLAISWPVW
jgi:hypothetical protein